MSQTLCVECGVLSDANDCPLCDLEKRVKELERKNVHAPSGTNLARATSYHLGIEPSGHSEMPSEPKPELYSGFTAEEWEQLAKLDYMLVEGWNDMRTGSDIGFLSNAYIADSGTIRFVFKACNGSTYGRDFVKLIEQPNWRPHMTDECPVPGRVKIQVEFEDGARAVSLASRFDWKRVLLRLQNIRAYRILVV